MAAKRTLLSHNLAERGVTLIAENGDGSLWLQCISCLLIFQVKPRGLGRLPSQFWTCPNQCNQGSPIGRPRNGVHQ